jgi:hypothetical protein
MPCPVNCSDPNCKWLTEPTTETHIQTLELCADRHSRWLKPSFDAAIEALRAGAAVGGNATAPQPAPAPVATPQLANEREVMRALLDGKKVRRDFWTPGTFVHLNADGVLRTGAGGPADVPESGEVYEEPNPYKQGLFVWAWFELKRGKVVRRAKWQGMGWRAGLLLRKEPNRELLLKASSVGRTDLRSDRAYLCPALIDATDWELVP